MSVGQATPNGKSIPTVQPEVLNALASLETLDCWVVKLSFSGMSTSKANLCPKD